MGATPFIETAQALAHLPFIFGSVDLPDLISGRLEHLLYLLCGPVPHFEEGMQEALNHEDLRKQRPPGIPGGLPAIYVDGPGPIVRIKIYGFFFEWGIALFQSVGIDP